MITQAQNIGMPGADSDRSGFGVGDEAELVNGDNESTALQSRQCNSMIKHSKFETKTEWPDDWRKTQNSES